MQGSEGVRIREAVPADLAAIIEAIERLNANGAAHEPRYVVVPDVAPRLREHLRELWFGRFLPFPAALVAQEGESLVGLVSAEIVPEQPILAFPPTARIDNLWVEPEHRRKGVARALVEEMRERTSAAGYSRLTVSTLVKDSRAVAFWRAMGFEDLFVVLSKP